MVTFAERGEQRDMLFGQTGLESDSSRDLHRTGWVETFDRLAAHLAALPSVRAAAG